MEQRSVTAPRRTRLSERIVRIDSCEITSTRPRVVGYNSFKGPHGDTITEPIVRITTDSGVIGWARSTASEAEAGLAIGRRIDEVFSFEAGAHAGYDRLDTALWDLSGRLAEKPVHALLGSHGPDRVAIYDGSIYMEDLDPASGTDHGLEPIADAVRAGLELGYRAFKLKIGRGHKWMEPKAGLRRDIEAIQTARETAGPDCRLLVDANNGYTPAEARELVRQVRDCALFWFEEPFPESIEDSLPFKRFLAESDHPVLLADGEGTRPSEPAIRAVIRAGAIDVVQFDLRPVPIGSWLDILPLIEEVGLLAAPHNWHSHLLNYYIPHFGRGMRIFCMGETDISSCPAVDRSAYRLVDGLLQIPDKPGFGLELDHAWADEQVRAVGWVCE